MELLQKQYFPMSFVIHFLIQQIFIKDPLCAIHCGTL